LRQDIIICMPLPTFAQRGFINLRDMQACRVDIHQGNLNFREFGEGENVSEQVEGKDDASGTDKGNLRQGNPPLNNSYLNEKLLAQYAG
jgi:hypothetical protein